jgi:amidase
MILGVIAGTDPEDPWSADADDNRTSYVAALDTASLRGARLGVIRPTTPDARGVRRLLDDAIEVLEREGAEILETPAEELIDPRPEMRIVLLQDFKIDLNAYLASTPETVPTRTLDELIAFSLVDPRERMHTMDYWEDAQATEGARTDPTYQAALRDGRRLTRDEGIDRLLAEYGIDAVVSATSAPPARIEPDGTPRVGPIPPGPRGTRPPSLTVVAAVAGYPLISVPMGLVDGLPVGITFAGTAWSEARLIGLAYDYEQASLARVPPARALRGG